MVGHNRLILQFVGEPESQCFWVSYVGNQVLSSLLYFYIKMTAVYYASMLRLPESCGHLLASFADDGRCRLCDEGSAVLVRDGSRTFQFWCIGCFLNNRVDTWYDICAAFRPNRSVSVITTGVGYAGASAQTLLESAQTLLESDGDI